MTRIEYAVRAETIEGSTFTLRRGFTSEEEAGNHPVKMSLWHRVWIEPIGQFVEPKSEPTLPPFPWNWVAASVVDARGSFHAYLVDGTGRKIAAIWGKDGEKKLIADHIVSCVNPAAVTRADEGDGV
jgi:hypothetical protein